MFTDLLLFDECRYIYDWIPAIHQIPMAFSNPSWQYTFRFGLDGLIKQRINYNNEFFFQGSVVSKTVPRFEAQSFPERIRLNKEKLEKDKALLNKCQLTLMPKRKQSLNDRDKVNYLLSRARTVLSMRFIPIQSYAAASSKSDVIRNYMLLKVEKESVDETIASFEQIVSKLFNIRSSFIKISSYIADNSLFLKLCSGDWLLYSIHQQINLIL